MGNTLFDRNQSTFIYGLTTIDGSEFEDPTFLGFTIELDETSELFNTDSTKLNISTFLENNQNNSEIFSRTELYKQFVDNIKKVFNNADTSFTTSNQTSGNKQHYINSISGLENLSKKFIIYKEDKLTVQLHEDITLFSSYLSTLYNNLVYSYETGRRLIPENLLKFNMYIKISEIRNLNYLSKFIKGLNDKYVLNKDDVDNLDLQLAEAIRSGTTSIIYKLYDCEFDFTKSLPFEDSITQAGIDSSYPQSSILEFDIIFKRVSRQIYNPLIKNSLAMNDNNINLDLILNIIGGTNNSNNGEIENINSVTNDPINKPVQKQSVNTKNLPKPAFFTEAFNTQFNKDNLNNIKLVPSEFPENKKELRDNVVKVTTKNFNANNNKLLKNNTIQETGETDNNALGFIESPYFESSNYEDLFKEKQKLISSNGTYNDIEDQDDVLNPNNVSLNPVNIVKSTAENFKKNVKKALKKSAKDILNKAENLANNKKNELLNNFVTDINNNLGIKKIIPENIYKEKFIFNQFNLKQLGGQIGNDILTNTLNELKKSTNINL